jgi:protein phosphatase
VLRLPDPSLVVLIGAAGSGKSTLAARLFPADSILSSDALRALVSGDAADQRATRTAFSILHRQLERRMAVRQTTVIDATSVTAIARRGLVRRAAEQGIPAVAFVLDLDPETVLARNAGRLDRVVPEHVVRRHLAELERSLRPGGLDREGFAAIHRLRTTAEMDRLTIEWFGRA